MHNKVTQIGANAFKNCKKITSVIIPATITDIADNVFYGCSKLKKITIKSKSITQIDSGAFVKNAKNATIKVPSNKLAAYKKLLKGKITKGVKFAK